MVTRYMDFREHARLAAIVSRRRKQLARLEQEVIALRKRLEDDENALKRLREYTCNAAGRALAQCAQAKRKGKEANNVCSAAATALQRCGKLKKEL